MEIPVLPTAVQGILSANGALLAKGGYLNHVSGLSHSELVVATTCVEQRTTAQKEKSVGETERQEKLYLS